MPDWLRRLAQDRLVWFVVLGLALFGADRLLQARSQNIIKIDLPLVEKLVAQWEGQTERRPNARDEHTDGRLTVVGRGAAPERQVRPVGAGPVGPSCVYTLEILLEGPGERFIKHFVK